jgi:hypothetical protein
MTRPHAIATQLASARSKIDGLRFGQLALFFALFLILVPMLKHGVLVKCILSLLLLNSLLVADAARPGARFLRRIGWSLWAISAVGVLVEEFDVHDALAFAAKSGGIGAHTLLILVCAASILTVLFRPGRVSLDGIFASVVVYQLTGLFFAQLYTLMTLFDPASLQFPGGAPTSDQVVQFDMVYFSFVTLATLGYGDIVPVSDLARSTAILEAITGQFYVAVVVAVLVSAFVAQRLEDQASRAQSDATKQ